MQRRNGSSQVRAIQIALIVLFSCEVFLYPSCAISFLLQEIRALPSPATTTLKNKNKNMAKVQNPGKYSELQLRHALGYPQRLVC